MSDETVNGNGAAASTPERRGPDRRKSVVDQRTDGNGFERRRGPGRRRSDFVKAADEGEHTAEQFLFIKAVDAFKRANSKPYPSWTDVLEVMRKLGYRKTMPMSVALTDAEDWTETADAPLFQQTETASSDDADEDELRAEGEMPDKSVIDQAALWESA